MNTWQSLKRRLVAWVMLTALALAVLAPVRSAEAAGYFWSGPNHPNGGVMPNVSWNSGPQ